MMLKKNYLKYCFALIAVFAVLIIYYGKTDAQLSGEGLTISPPITELTLKPGESTTQTIRLTNPTDKIVEVYPKIMNFSAKGEGGEPAFFEATDESAKYSLARWIEVGQ